MNAAAQAVAEILYMDAIHAAGDNEDLDVVREWADSLAALVVDALTEAVRVSPVEVADALGLEQRGAYCERYDATRRTDAGHDHSPACSARHVPVFAVSGGPDNEVLDEGKGE